MFKSFRSSPERFERLERSLEPLILINHNPEILTPPSFWTSADADQTIHLGAQIHHVAARPGPGHRITHASAFGVDHHGLKDVERAGYVFLCNSVGL